MIHWKELSDRIRRSTVFERLCAGSVELSGAPLAAAAWTFELAADHEGRSLLVLLPRESDALRWVEGARLGGAGEGAGEDVVFFPSPSLSPYQETEVSLQVRAQESLALDRLFRAARPTLICTPRALFRPVPTRGQFERGVLELVVDEEVDLDQVVHHLVRWGYRRTELVAEVGSFAQRGGVLDVYPPGVDDPVRLDLFGDLIESIRSFDIASQRSGDAVGRVRVLPLTLFPTDEEIEERLVDRLLELGVDPLGEAGERLDQLRAGGFPGWENYLPTLLERRRTLADLEPLQHGWWVAVEPELLMQEIEHQHETLHEEFEHRRDAEQLAVEPEELGIEEARVTETVRRASHRISPLGARGSGGDGFEHLALGGRETDDLVGQLPRLPHEVDAMLASGEQVVFVARPGTEEGLSQMLGDRRIEVDGERVAVLTGDLERGFRWPLAGVTAYAEAQLIPMRRQRRRRTRMQPFLSGMRDLKVGEYVVHQDHGIGRFVGMRTLGGDDHTAQRVELPSSLGDLEPSKMTGTEVMELVYASGQTLLLPLQRLDQVQRYSGVEGLAPKLDKLGGSSWSRKKARVRKGLRKLAVDLLKLHAARELASAPAIEIDTDQQAQFEMAFAHTETEDQLSAVADIKQDLSSGKPMDRLLCGDVGFGKTEVAMRAAFKMVDNGYQVAVLAPTTILAAQHLDTFRQRYADFPVSIDMISRFRTPAEVKQIREKVRQGSLDILVGTHRLLSQDLAFPKLGLLVIDEEQRFGVAHKEKLKELRAEVHVLSMSATPVPRTLQLALTGVRELSTIESPPKDRMAVETQVMPYSSDLIRAAIEFELERGGQVYFVHNRVEDIEQVSRSLGELIPGLRITVGHGQLDERQLDERMRAFKDRQYDVLVATTIIENGIDIPNVNTMIVHRAENYGLSQLYQLRGRVGRSDTLGFCYLLTPADRILSEDARKRLQAIVEFTELGAGFRIAARDLEIRGAGDLLGAEQSGHISDLGIDTYLKMLEDTVRELKGERALEPVSAQIELPVSMSIPEDYVGDVNLRMDLYRRLAAGEEDSETLLEEMRERFGQAPREVRALVSAARLKQQAESLRVQAVAYQSGQLVLRMRRDARIDVDRLIELVAERGDATFTPSGVLTVGGVPPAESLSVARAVLARIAPEPAAASPDAAAGGVVA